jgi:hypothetical protein
MASNRPEDSVGAAVFTAAEAEVAVIANWSLPRLQRGLKVSVLHKKRRDQVG